MTISETVWKRYITKLRAVNDKASSEMLQYIDRFGLPETRAAQDAMLDFAYALATKYGEASAELACEMYDAIAELSNVILPAAVPAATATMEEVAISVVGTAKTGNNEVISSAVGRLVKMAGVDTIQQNAIRDKAEWAWIPSGETCAFCIALASNGWQPASKKALKGGHAEHIHANCDCTYVVRFTPQMQVGGYDPERYREIYDEAEGRNSTAKINDIRRELYAENREKINAQKRSAYEKMRERESSAAEEMNV